MAPDTVVWDALYIIDVSILCEYENIFKWTIEKGFCNNANIQNVIDTCVESDIRGSRLGMLGILWDTFYDQEVIYPMEELYMPILYKKDEILDFILGKDFERGNTSRVIECGFNIGNLYGLERVHQKWPGEIMNTPDEIIRISMEKYPNISEWMNSVFYI